MFPLSLFIPVLFLLFIILSFQYDIPVELYRRNLDLTHFQLTFGIYPNHISKAHFFCSVAFIVEPYFSSSSTHQENGNLDDSSVWWIKSDIEILILPATWLPHDGKDAPTYFYMKLLCFIHIYMRYHPNFVFQVTVQVWPCILLINICSTLTLNVTLITSQSPVSACLIFLYFCFSPLVSIW